MVSRGMQLCHEVGKYLVTGNGAHSQVVVVMAGSRTQAECVPSREGVSMAGNGAQEMAAMPEGRSKYFKEKKQGPRGSQVSSIRQWWPGECFGPL